MSPGAFRVVACHLLPGHRGPIAPAHDRHGAIARDVWEGRAQPVVAAGYCRCPRPHHLAAAEGPHAPVDGAGHSTRTRRLPVPAATRHTDAGARQPAHRGGSSPYLEHAAGATRPAERAGRDNAGPTRTRAALAGSPDCRASTAAGRRTAAGIRRIAAAHRHIADGGRAAAGHLAQIAPGLPGTGHERPVGPGTGGAVAAAGARRCRAAD
ncbi:hypothetical protein G6F24_014883 [Rhizopus arrhizus]|nr:hypothetical protein G6F24_014883 [Rhizopus arrhizus]